MQKSRGVVNRASKNPYLSRKPVWAMGRAALRAATRRAILRTPKSIGKVVIKKGPHKSSAAELANKRKLVAKKAKSVIVVTSGKHPADKTIFSICRNHPELKTDASVLYAWLDLVEKDPSLKANGVNRGVVVLRIKALREKGLILRK